MPLLMGVGSTRLLLLLQTVVVVLLQLMVVVVNFCSHVAQLCPFGLVLLLLVVRVFVTYELVFVKGSRRFGKLVRRRQSAGLVRRQTARPGRTFEHRMRFVVDLGPMS